MDLSGRVNQNFQDNTSATHMALEVMAEPIVRASQTMTRALLAGGKIITCGNAGAGLIAQYLVTLMLGQLQLPRPGLPAICLSSDTATLSAIAADAGSDLIFANQVGALGQHSDVLFAISNQGDDVALLAAARVAHDRDMRVISLTGGSGDVLSAVLKPADVEISVPSENKLRTHEIQVLTIHCICDLIDNQLLGA